MEHNNDFYLLTLTLIDDPEFRQWVIPLISRLIPILLHPKAPRSLHENAAVSIGRIGLMHPALVAPHLPEFSQAWCQALYEIRDNEEKDSAFRGLCTMVQVYPAGITKASFNLGLFRFRVDVASFRRFYCMPNRASSGSVIRSSDGTSHRQNLTKCSEHYCKGSSNMMQRVGSHRFLLSHL